ncbi:MAG: SDR family oxidoreductase [Pirellulales bacterium]|nr:SDR family oxidoreductase [Pirellulales bacterium]
MQRKTSTPCNGSGRAVLVTGASTGIGAACALALDRLGWRVFAGIRDDEAGRRLAERASSRFVPLWIDVTDSAQIDAAAEQIAETLGDNGLDGLVNNAGIGVLGPLEAVPIDDLRRQLEVNVLGQIAVTQAMLPLLRRSAGRIVMMGSVSGRVASPYMGPYAASKFALEAVTDALRVELRRWKIAVSIIEPGSVVTPIWDKAKTSARRLADTLSPEMMRFYGEEIETFEQVADEFATAAMPVDRVVDAVVHALTARRPRTRYPLGLSARLSIRLLPLVPDRIRDWIVCRAIGLRR